MGGKILHWGREVRRLSDLDFRAADHDGYGENWPIRYADLAPYYDRVESFIGVSGSIENIPHVPDGKYLPPMALNCGEKIIQKVASKVGMRLITSRQAMRTKSVNGLGRCHYCGGCGRGCAVGGFWNSISDTLPAAMKTGRMTLRPNSVVREVLVDENGKARGVAIVDRLTKKDFEVRSRVVVLAASALESTRIMLNSVSRFWPNCIANSSGVLGHYLMENFGYERPITAFLPVLKGSKVTNEDGKVIGFVHRPVSQYNGPTSQVYSLIYPRDMERGTAIPWICLRASGLRIKIQETGELPPALFNFTWILKRQADDSWKIAVDVWNATPSHSD